MFKLPPARIAQALLMNIDKGVKPEEVAAQLATIPGVKHYVQTATVDGLWSTLMGDRKARAVIGNRAVELYSYVEELLAAAVRSIA